MYGFKNRKALSKDYDGGGFPNSDQATPTLEQKVQEKLEQVAETVKEVTREPIKCVDRHGNELRDCTQPSQYEIFEAQHPHDIADDIRRERYGATYKTNLQAPPSTN